MPLPRDARYPRQAHPETFLSGTSSGDLEDGEQDLIDDLFALELWDDIDQWETQLGQEIRSSL